MIEMSIEWNPVLFTEENWQRPRRQCRAAVDPLQRRSLSKAEAINSDAFDVKLKQKLPSICNERKDDTVGWGYYGQLYTLSLEWKEQEGNISPRGAPNFKIEVYLMKQNFPLE